MKHSLMKTVGTIALGAALLTAAPVQARGWGNGGNHSWGGHGGHNWGGHNWGGGHWGGGHNWGRHWGGGHWGGRGYWGGGWGYPGGYYYDDSAAILGAGILGLAAGAAIASDRYDDGYSDWGYDPYGYPDY
jgi:hypothetical protein